MDIIKVGIIGSGADKFTEASKQIAFSLIRKILESYQEKVLIVVSGHSPVGGIDIWSEEVANELNLQTDLKVPKQHKWDSEYGFKQRNIDIAKSSHELHIVLVDKYPPNYKGMKFEKCYHCDTSTHVKSGACWTGNVASKLGKKVYVHIINNKEE